MTPDEAEGLIQRFLDGEINKKEFAQLEKILQRNELAREMLRDYAFIQSAMQVPAEGQPQLQPERTIQVQRKKSFPMAGSLAIAAGIALMAGLGFFLMNGDPEVDNKNLVFQVAADTRYVMTSSTTGESTEENVIPVGANFSISQGTVQLDFARGVRSIISAPASFTLASENKLNLHEGKAWFQVPESGKGFTVETPRMLMVDHGTEFGAIVMPGSRDEIHVLTGEVSAKALFGNQAEELLHGGQSRLVDTKGNMEEAPELIYPFATSLPSGLHYLHFPFDEVLGTDALVLGEHPSLASLEATMIQSDEREAATRLVEGRFGKAVSFDRKGDMIKTNWPGVYGEKPLTISYWLKPQGVPNNAGVMVWGKWSDQLGENHQWKVALKEGADNGQRSPYRFRCSWGPRAATEVPISVSPDTWSHFAMVYSGKVEEGKPPVRFFANGEEIEVLGTKFPKPPTRPDGPGDVTPLTFGHALDWPAESARYRINRLEGELDEVFIIEGALDEEQIQKLYRENVYRP